MMINVRNVDNFTGEMKFLSFSDATVYIYMSIWKAGRDLRKQGYHQRKRFIPN